MQKGLQEFVVHPKDIWAPGGCAWIPVTGLRAVKAAGPVPRESLAALSLRKGASCVRMLTISIFPFLFPVDRTLKNMAISSRYYGILICAFLKEVELFLLCMFKNK